jgi:hypothetical protein
VSPEIAVILALDPRRHGPASVPCRPARTPEAAGREAAFAGAPEYLPKLFL